jgi:hypothetical protein
MPAGIVVPAGTPFLTSAYARSGPGQAIADKGSKLMSHSARSAGARPVIATPAGVWSCWLGGTDGTATDRETARVVQQAWPGAMAAAAAGQEFARAVTWYATFSRGIRQVLDVGAMLPGPGLVSDAEKRALRDCRVIRAGSGPSAAGPEGGTGAAQVRSDVGDPSALLAASGKFLDFTEPVLVLLVAVLDFVSDDDSAARVAGNLAAALAPGSLIAVSHLTADQAPGQVSAGIAAWNARVPAAWQPRNRAAVAALFGGLPLLLPGLVPAPWWRAIPGRGLKRPGDVYGGVAGLPGDPAAIVSGAVVGSEVPA